MKSSGRSRTNEMLVSAGVTFSSFGNCSASSANAVATTTCPATFAQPPRPRLCCLRVFRKSSTKPTSAEADHHAQDEHRRRGRRLARHQECRREVAEEAAEDEDDAAHGGRAALDVVALRPVVADELSPSEPGEQPDEQRGEEQREGERQRPGGQQCSHANHSPSRSPRRRRPAEFDDFTSTVSPGRAEPTTRSYASSAVST